MWRATKYQQQQKKTNVVDKDAAGEDHVVLAEAIGVVDTLPVLYVAEPEVGSDNFLTPHPGESSTTLIKIN